MLADDVIIIAAGQLVAQGPVEQIVGSMSHRPAGCGSARRDAEKLTAELHRRRTVDVEPGPDGALLVSGVDAPAVGAAALGAGVELHELVAERPDLEQVFLELTQGKAGIR